MTYKERRLRVFELAGQMGQLIREAGEDRSMLWRVATDDLSDAVTMGSPEALREAFTDVCRRDWYSANELYSVKVEPRTDLRLVTEDEFEAMSRGRSA